MTAISRLKRQCKRNIRKLIDPIKGYNFIEFCLNNTPGTKASFLYFGVFSIILLGFMMYNVPAENLKAHNEILTFVYVSSFLISVIFTLLPLFLLQTKKKDRVLAVFWLLSLGYIFIFTGFLHVIICDFDQFYLLVFLVSVIALTVFTSLSALLLILTAGIILCLCVYKIYAGTSIFVSDLSQLTPKLLYVLLMAGAIAIFRPRQYEYKVAKEKLDHLDLMLRHSHEEVEKLQDMKNEFIRNIKHELNTPMMGIVSIGEILDENYNTFDDKQRQKIIKDIVSNARRLEGLIKNVISLSNLSSLSYNLCRTRLDLGKLISKRIKKCKELYLGEKNLEFITDIDQDIFVEVDKYYIQQTLDNLITNAINYNDNGKIAFSLQIQENMAVFAMSDEGIGVPEEELEEIFGAFVTSSRTKTSAGGRGVGLALCDKVIKLHGGKIWAESNIGKGVTFKFILPLKS